MDNSVGPQLKNPNFPPGTKVKRGNKGPNFHEEKEGAGVTGYHGGCVRTMGEG